MEDSATQRLVQHARQVNTVTVEPAPVSQEQFVLTTSQVSTLGNVCLMGMEILTG
jgi:hypothetical protein